MSNWDGHKAIEKQYSVHGPVFDQPTAALIRDLKQRGLLKDTLVVCGSEFGRTPVREVGASGGGGSVKRTAVYNDPKVRGYLKAVDPMTMNMAGTLTIRRGRGAGMGRMGMGMMMMM